MLYLYIKTMETTENTFQTIFISPKQKYKLNSQEEFKKYGIQYISKQGGIQLIIPNSFTIVKKYSGDNTFTTITNKDVRIELNEKNTSYDSYCNSYFYTDNDLASIIVKENELKDKQKLWSNEFSSFVKNNFSSCWSQDDCYVVYFFKSELYDADRYYSGCTKPIYYHIDWDKYKFIGYTNQFNITNTDLYKELKQLHKNVMSSNNMGYQIGYENIIIRHMMDGHKNLHIREYEKFTNDTTEVIRNEIGTKININMKHITIPFYDN